MKRDKLITTWNCDFCNETSNKREDVTFEGFVMKITDKPDIITQIYIDGYGDEQHICKECYVKNLTIWYKDFMIEWLKDQK